MFGKTFLLAAVISVLVFAGTAFGDTKPYWVFFRDRGTLDVEKAIAKKIVSPSEPKNNCRRAKLLTGTKLFDEKDIPVCDDYVKSVSDLSVRIRTLSRYLNGVSVDIDEDSVEKLKALPFVREVRPVRVTVGKLDDTISAEKAEKPAETQSWDSAEYSGSYYQASLINTVKLHNLGYTGTGIKIAILDSGFDGLTHNAFDSLDVERKWDFVGQDSDPSGHNHGTKVLSIMAALDPGNMIGISPSATYLLGRTEIVQNGAELRQEEDYLVAGIEWADSLGADIINISLGYTRFDDGTGYTYSDLNGDTAITTIAADAAAERGISVVVSAGNEGPDPWSSDMWYYVSTPADGDSVIAVGSVNMNGAVSLFSSRGPTPDGRVKPDFMAMGENVWMVNTSTTDSYMNSESGTSYSAPAVSAAIALIMEANPLWSNMQVYDNLKETAVDKGIADADSLYGYGIIDAFSASGKSEPEPSVAKFKVYDPFPQPVVLNSGSKKIYFPMDVPAANTTLTIKIFSFNGENINTLISVFSQAGSFLDPGSSTGSAPSWDGTNYSGEYVAPGVYFYTVKLTGYGTYKGKLMVMR